MECSKFNARRRNARVWHIQFWTTLVMIFVGIVDQRWILFWHKMQASSHVLMQVLVSSSRNEHIAVCSRYGIRSEDISTDHVKFSDWSAFEQSAA